jgi:hypothetical protein
MTEAEWRTSVSPNEMLRLLLGGARLSVRKARLFAAACCRRRWAALTDQRSREAVEAAEDYAEGLMSGARLEAVARGAFLARANLGDPHSHAGDAAHGAVFPSLNVVYVAEKAATDAAYQGYRTGGRSKAAYRAASAAERAAQAPLLRDLFGPLPFRTLPLEGEWLSWNGGTVRRLAEAVYEQRQLPSGHLDNALLAVLADALEEAGCRDADILAHCRQEGAVHVRGCFVIDLLLGKA